MPYLGDDTVIRNGERIVSAYAEGLDGLSNDGCRELAEDNIVTSKQCAVLQEALRGGAGGIVTAEEVGELRSSGLSNNLIDAIRGVDGKQALQARAKALGDTADGYFMFDNSRHAAALKELKLMGKEGISEICRIILKGSLQNPTSISQRAFYELYETADVTDPDVISAFISALNFGSEDMRKIAASALLKAGESAVPKLIEAANEIRGIIPSVERAEPERLRLIAVIDLLDNINSTSSQIDSTLIGMLSDNFLTDAVKQAAADVLVKRGSLAASAVANLLQDSDQRVRAMAADILGRMGSVAAFAVPKLEKTLHDPELDVRVSVLSALWLIYKETAKDVMDVPTFQNTNFPPRNSNESQSFKYF